jgi:hypothetical protein
MVFTTPGTAGRRRFNVQPDIAWCRRFSVHSVLSLAHRLQ